MPPRIVNLSITIADDLVLMKELASREDVNRQGIMAVRGGGRRGKEEGGGGGGRMRRKGMGKDEG